MKSVQKGFTLIELMIVIAIIGVLAAIAMPAYQDYVKRGHVSEGLNLAAGAKAGVAEYYSTEGAWPSDNGEAGLAAAGSIVGNAVNSVAVSGNGLITITYNTKVAANAQLRLTPTNSGGSIEWNCAPANNAMDPTYVPARCRP